ncbi:putative Cysteine-rich secretory protein 2 [Hypsibius exemplaris]|uniref:Cysteine-rich secretory protein 2 n=1 Tax=Hypsibius exemplaris TaxID=2072580 RepID=A0A1W0XA46_HYPEX|nr:putative Cysteine-rich secretory protein 2 [Hypsibius exemplaris]
MLGAFPDKSAPYRGITGWLSGNAHTTGGELLPVPVLCALMAFRCSAPDATPPFLLVNDSTRESIGMPLTRGTPKGLALGHLLCTNNCTPQKDLEGESVSGYRRTRSDDVSLAPRYNSHLAQRIVDIHNRVRSGVSPTAGNMLKMEWSAEAAQKAQDWADTCRSGHNDKSERRIGQTPCGQNLLRTFSGPFSWDDVLKIWSTDEAPHFRYGSHGNNMHVVGHYTQMVWATTFQVGCAYKNCGYWQHYVCHYCPSGNLAGEERYPYKSSTPCSACPGKCENNLCRNSSCPYTDVYSNCADIARRFNICSRSRWASVCGATCRCAGKIF